MKETIKPSISLQNIILLDIAVLAFIYYVPAMVHGYSFPIYYCEPMRLSLFVSIFILGENKKNTYFLALTLPIFSYMISGHPVAMKNVIMTVELLTNVFLLYYLSNMRLNRFVSCFASIAVSKLLYYGMKYALIRAGILKTGVIDTPLAIQLVLTTILSFIFIITYKR